MRFATAALVASVLACFAAGATAQSQDAKAVAAVHTSGTLIVVPAYSEVRQANDEATASFMLEEQDRDKGAAASRVNQRMKQATEILKREDPQAVLKTHGYYTYPVHAEDAPRQNRKPQIVGWRVGQYLELKTANIARLPRTVAAVQNLVGLNGLQYGLSDAAMRRLDARRIDEAYRHLVERVASIARAMGRQPSDAVIEVVDFEASGAYAQDNAGGRPMMKAAMAERAAPPVEEPNFEPGETTLQMHVVGKIRFK